MSLLYVMVAHEQAPAMIVDHLRENDLGMCKGMDLMIRAKKEGLRADPGTFSQE